MEIKKVTLYIVDAFLVNGHPATTAVNLETTERIIRSNEKFLQCSLATLLPALVHTRKNQFILIELKIIHLRLIAHLTINKQHGVVNTILIACLVHAVKSLNGKCNVAPSLYGIAKHPVLQFEDAR